MTYHASKWAKLRQLEYIAGLCSTGPKPTPKHLTPSPIDFEELYKNAFTEIYMTSRKSVKKSTEIHLPQNQQQFVCHNSQLPLLADRRKVGYYNVG